MARPANKTKLIPIIDATDESTPLLGAPDAGPPASSNGVANGKADAESQEQRMPYGQVLILCYASLAEPIAYFSIFPFINEMLERNGRLPESDVGFYAGAIESLFSLVQMVLMIFYGRMADRLGRKPVLVFSMAGVSIATALFGLGRTLWQMILLRCLAGVFAGSVVTIRTMLSENTSKETQGRAFSWYMFTRNLGIFLGPLVGGGLANPSQQFPNVFGGIQFLEDYPYALATFAAGFVCLTGTLASLFGLRETLKRKEYSSGASEPEMSTWQVLRAPGVAIVLLIFGHTMVLALGYTAVMPVVMFTRIELGGFSFSPQYISYVLAIAGLSQALWILIVFPILQKRLGTGLLLRCCAVLWPFFMVAYPILNEFLRHGYTVAFWTIGIISTILGSAVAMAFACVQLCINDVSPSPTVLATVNALSLTVNCAIRAVAPALFTSIYAFGVRSRWADGHLIWFVIVPLASLFNVTAYYLPPQAEGRPDPNKKDDQEQTSDEQ